MNELQIIPFGDDLASHFRTLNEPWISRVFGMDEANRLVLADPKGHIIDKGGAIYFARVADKIVGCAALVFHEAATYELAKMAVLPEYRKNGIGRALALEIIALARQRQANELFLLSSSKLTAAIALYESLGFVHRPGSDRVACQSLCNLEMTLSF